MQQPDRDSKPGVGAKNLTPEHTYDSRGPMNALDLMAIIGPLSEHWKRQR